MASSYSSYLRKCGVKAGEFNAFVMTERQWRNSQQTIQQKHAELEQQLVNCQQAWYNACMAGMFEDAEHAKANERKALQRLVDFEKENGL